MGSAGRGKRVNLQQELMDYFLFILKTKYIGLLNSILTWNPYRFSQNIGLQMVLRKWQSRLQQQCLGKVKAFRQEGNRTCAEPQMEGGFTQGNLHLEQQQNTHMIMIRHVQFSSVAQSCPTLCDPWTAACQASLSITNTRSLHKLMSIKSVMPSNHLILCRPLLLPSIPPSIRVFSNESVLCIRWPKYWSFSFNTSPSNEHLGLISFRMDWLDLLSVQGTLKSLL